MNVEPISNHAGLLTARSAARPVPHRQTPRLPDARRRPGRWHASMGTVAQDGPFAGPSRRKPQCRHAQAAQPMLSFQHRELCQGCWRNRRRTVSRNPPQQQCSGVLSWPGPFHRTFTAIEDSDGAFYRSTGSAVSMRAEAGPPFAVGSAIGFRGRGLQTSPNFRPRAPARKVSTPVLAATGHRATAPTTPQCRAVRRCPPRVTRTARRRRNVCVIWRA